MNKKMYVMPRQQVVDLALRNGVADPTGGLNSTSPNGGIDEDEGLVREERDWGTAESPIGSHRNVWEQW